MEKFEDQRLPFIASLEAAQPISAKDLAAMNAQEKRFYGGPCHSLGSNMIDWADLFGRRKACVPL